MLSELAMEDIKILAAEGISLSPSEIVRLNELGLRVECSSESSDVMACPRVGWAGTVPVYQPTIQVDEWAETYAKRFSADEDSYWSLFLFACCHAVIRGFFQRECMRTPEGIAVEVKKWRDGLPVTNEQLQTAFQYAYTGGYPGCDVAPVPSEKELKEIAERKEPDKKLGAVEEAIAAGLSLSIDDMNVLTSSYLWSIVNRHYANKGYSGSASNVRQQSEYIRTLAAIKKDHLDKKALADG